MILKFMVTVTLVGSVLVGSEQLWAVQLTTHHEEVVEEVAEELGLMVVGRVFNDVFLFAGEMSPGKKDDGEAIGDDQEKKSEKLHHPLIVWSEQQTGHRRTSRTERSKDIENEEKRKEKHTREKWKYREWKHTQRSPISRDKNNFGRPPRNVGGVNQRILKSPWSFQKARDPLRWRQWYLGEGGGMHLNVTGLWDAGIKGGGISVAILDDGVELTHLDLALNYDPAASWDLLDADPDPMPVSWSRHGTQLAGIIAATHFNGMCGMGVAPWSGVGAVRMLGYVVYDAVEAAALSYERDHVDVYVAAWGPVDTGAVMEGPGILASRAIRESIALGRNGLGSIYVWASGNGGYVGDDCNADGYSNSVYTLTVSGSTKNGRAPDYAETCAATFVSTYSGDADDDIDEVEEQINGIVTTDLGGVCTESFRGSSVSAAMVSGACALALDVNPQLGWRDIQHLMVHAATPYNPLPSQWNTNGVGIMYSHYFGFGALNGGKMADLAREWQNVPPSFRCYAHSPYHNITLVPDETLTLAISVTECQIIQAEHIQVNISLTADNRGQIEIGLRSPSGTFSNLLPQRPLDLSPYGIQNHPLLSVHMWGEDPRGIWKIYITYHSSSILDSFGGKRYVDTPNMLQTCSLIVHGTEVFIDQATIHDHHYNKTQLSQALHRRNRTKNLSKDEIPEREETITEADDATPRIVVEHWISTSKDSTDTLLYLFCRVSTPLPHYVTNILWQNSLNEPFNDVIRRLRGYGPRAAKYPSLLVIRKTEEILGNFTCKITYNNEEHSKEISISSNYSSIPHTTETVRVAVEGDDVVLPCENLSPILRGTWMKDSAHLKSTSRLTISEDQLLLRNVQANDTGVYECHKNAPILHYSHRSSITLLMANGPTTLIQYYAIDSHPPIPEVLPPPPFCTFQSSSDLEETENSTSSFTVDTLGLPERQCPPPYRPIDGHCLLIGAGPARPWHQARQQCRRRRGELLVVHDASLMLALIQLLHTQGLASKSFWVGGLREDVGSWRWVDGIPMPLAAPFWFLTPTRQPQEVPIIQRNDERSLDDFGSRREVFGPGRGIFMKSTRPQTSHARPSLLRKLGLQESSYSPRRRQMRGTRRKRILGSRPRSRPGKPHLKASIKKPQDRSRNNHERSSFPEAMFPRDKSSGSAHGNSRNNNNKKGFPERASHPRGSGNSRTSQRFRKPRPKGRMSQAAHTRSGRPKANTRSGRPGASGDQLVPKVRNSTKGPSSSEADLSPEAPPRPRRTRPPEEDLSSEANIGRSRLSKEILHPRDIRGQRAACMWAGLRHFFGSCSVLERLSALCEYKES